MADSRENARAVRFALNITGDVYQSYYAGAAQAVVVNSFDGRSIQFPAKVLQQFVTRDGVQGVFEMEFDEQNKFVAIWRVKE